MKTISKAKLPELLEQLTQGYKVLVLAQGGFSDLHL